MQKFEFEGINSGDSESFCWIVDKENFIKATGNEPDEFDGVPEYTTDGLDYAYSKERFYLYPNDVTGESGAKVKITIVVEEIEEYTENED